MAGLRLRVCALGRFLFDQRWLLLTHLGITGVAVSVGAWLALALVTVTILIAGRRIRAQAWRDHEHDVELAEQWVTLSLDSREAYLRTNHTGALLEVLDLELAHQRRAAAHVADLAAKCGLASPSIAVSDVAVEMGHAGAYPHPTKPGALVISLTTRRWSDERLVAVLAHEVGHLATRRTIAAIARVQLVGSVVLAVAVAGGLADLSPLTLLLPSVWIWRVIYDVVGVVSVWIREAAADRVAVRLGHGRELRAYLEESLPQADRGTRAIHAPRMWLLCHLVPSD